MKKLRLAIGGLVVILLSHGPVLWAATGCTLNDPDRDVRRIFPQSTGYKTEFITIQERGGETLAREVERLLGDPLDSIYETPDVPYAYYIVLQGKEVIGYVHGVNQKGMYGGMQLILATDLKGDILDFYYQKISSPESGKFRAPGFTDQFKGLTLRDFEDGKTEGILDPSKKSRDDFSATLRGIKKNLILLDLFKLNGEKGRGELAAGEAS